jgi:hypothetical protein
MVNVIAIMLIVLALAVGFAIKTGFLLLALWIMVKIQKFQFHFWGLLGSAAAASALDMIPFVGHFIALPVLYICLLKVTREDFTGVVFTAGISYALVFAMNMFVLGSLMGDLRPDLHASAKGRTTSAQTTQTVKSDDDDDSDTNHAAKPSQPSTTTKAPPAATPQAKPAPTPPQPAARPAEGPPSEPQFAHVFSIKGITKNANNSMAIIHSGVKTYTIALGESLSMETTKGRVVVTCEKVGDKSILLKVGDEQVLVSQ